MCPRGSSFPATTWCRPRRPRTSTPISARSRRCRRWGPVPATPWPRSDDGIAGRVSGGLRAGLTAGERRRVGRCDRFNLLLGSLRRGLPGQEVLAEDPVRGAEGPHPRAVELLGLLVGVDVPV